MSHSTKEDIVKICRLLHAKGYLAAADGNVSAAIDPNSFLITPSGVSKRLLHSEDILGMNDLGQSEVGIPSSEKWMHLAVYKHCPKARAVIHAHPPYSIAWTIARPTDTSLPIAAMSEVILGVGCIPIVPYITPGSAAISDHLAPYLHQSRVMILARHGILTYGETLEEAYMGVERLEHAAQTLALAMSMGQVTELEPSHVEILRTMRKQMPETIK